MKKRIPTFAAGMLTMALIGSASIGALAAAGQLNITVDPINIQVNGETFQPKDAAGKDVPVFAYNGTTYAPLRALAEAYGLEVGYDAGANMATVSSASATTPNASTGTVLMDKNGVKITFLGFAEKPSGLKGYDIKLKIENTSAKNYTVQARDLSINDTMVTSLVFSSNVVAGKTANDAIWVYNLEESGVTLPIEKAEFYFTIFNSDDWMDSFDSDVVTVK